jgi:hypothetical protein
MAALQWANIKLCWSSQFSCMCCIISSINCIFYGTLTTDECLSCDAFQALVAHLAQDLKAPLRVERCVLHLDVTSMDLDQVGACC